MHRTGYKIVRRVVALTVAIFCTASLAVGNSEIAMAADSDGTVDMYRLYNRHNGEHFYTASSSERDNLRSAGWKYEGIGWVAPEHSDTPVYRLFNPYASDHHYTTSISERDDLVGRGWRDEGIGWYSSDTNREFPVYRQYNPPRCLI
ncbi:hypothetical protein [Bifidobacterium sp. SO4]|uniref:hypothetical protein n=1 Tax=Bifidobacterium sp. SO4 TaxID=2809030 RepID=UPI001BDBB4AE|nr:hypothetical protein [Bifidobacterium sp. SO4]MBT1171751.1 hypothetical protein [Bifidobacterium sp. SO4]